MNRVRRFDFADHADEFDEHIGSSIPGYWELRAKCVALSQRFIQDGTTVLDVGCSTGRLLADIREHNAPIHADVTYIGIDVQSAFARHWDRLQKGDLQFQLADIRNAARLTNLSLVSSLFTVQFLPEKDKELVLSKIMDGLVPGGTLIIAEKVLASSARLQDALVPPYYDFKRKAFSAAEILKKERDLRGVMTCWSERELEDKLRSAGFRELQSFWKNFPFVALMALK